MFRYVLRGDRPYCIKCYESVFANNCDECGKIIGIDSKDLSYKEKHWHESCFQCNKCRTSLVDKQFGSKADRIYCGGCYDAQFAARCDGCKDVFKAGMKKMEYKTRQWHEKCFVCCTCVNTIGTKSFIPKENDIYCTACYEDKYATKCIKCSKVRINEEFNYELLSVVRLLPVEESPTEVILTTESASPAPTAPRPWQVGSQLHHQ